MFVDMIVIAIVQDSCLCYWHTTRDQIYLNLQTPYWDVKLKRLETTRIDVVEMCV